LFLAWDLIEVGIPDEYCQDTGGERISTRLVSIDEFKELMYTEAFRQPPFRFFHDIKHVDDLIKLPEYEGIPCPPGYSK
jgi:hypothetical protein